MLRCQKFENACNKQRNISEILEEKRFKIGEGDWSCFQGNFDFRDGEFDPLPKKEGKIG